MRDSKFNGSFAKAIAILWLAPVVQAGTFWVNDFETADLKGIQFQPLQFGLRSSSNASTLATSDIFGGALNMKFNWSAIKPFNPGLSQQSVSMALDRTKNYVIKIQMELESNKFDGIPMTLQWDDGSGDGTAGFNSTEQVTFTAFPNVGKRSFTFYTNDTTTWPGFAHFGKDSGDNADIQYWLIKPATGYVTPADLDNHVFKIHHIEFKEYTPAPDPLVIASYFPAESTREVSQQNGIWGLFTSFTNPATHYEVQYSGDTYVTTDKKEVANTFYPRVGLYDALDPKILEYHILQAKASGVDGFAIENAIPNNPSFRVQMNDVMYAMSDLVKDMHFDFQVGLNFLASNYGAWRKDDPGMSWTTRDDMRHQMQIDMKQWLDDIYAGRQTGIWVGGRPAILVFNLSNANVDPNGTDVDQSSMGPDDFVQMRSYLNSHSWGGVSAPLLNPVFLGNDAWAFSSLYGTIEGAFPWTHSQWNGGVTELPPWEYFNTRSSIVNSYLNTYYSNCMNWSGHGPMAYFMGGALRGFDDHKGHSWGTVDVKRYIASDAGETLDDSVERFQSQSDTPLLFVVEWPEYKEATGVDPNREQGYAHMEKLANRIWSWRGAPQNYSPTLLRMPERLLGVRTTIDFLLKAGYAPTDSEITELKALADTASWAIHNLDQTAADTALDSAEASAQTLMSGLTTTWFDLRWTQGGSGNTILQSWPTTPPTVLVDGKTGLAFAAANSGYLRFKISDSATRTAIDDGYFVGKVRVEYLDRGTNWFYSATDNSTPAVFQFALFKNLARFLAKDSGTWRQVEYDLVNVDFHQGLTGSSDLEFQEQLYNGSSYASGLYSIRILGTSYKKP